MSSDFNTWNCIDSRMRDLIIHIRVMEPGKPEALYRILKILRNARVAYNEFAGTGFVATHNGLRWECGMPINGNIDL